MEVKWFTTNMTQQEASTGKEGKLQSGFEHLRTILHKPEGMAMLKGEGTMKDAQKIFVAVPKVHVPSVQHFADLNHFQECTPPNISQMTVLAGDPGMLRKTKE